MKKSDIHIQASTIKIEIKKFFNNNFNVKISNNCLISILLIGNKKNYCNALITGDIIWFSELCVKKIRNLVSKDLGISKESITLSASHTHGTPNPDSTIEYPNYSKSFDEYVTNKIVECYEQTKIKKKKKVRLEFRRILNNDFSVNRRRTALSFKKGIKYHMQNLPNFSKSIDKNIDLVDFIDTNTKKKVTTIVKVNCHPVSSPKGLIGSDYIGYLRKRLSKKNHYLFFLQGLCGDIRPKIIKSDKTLKDFFINMVAGKRFRKPNFGDAENISNEITSLIKKVTKEKKGEVIQYIGKCSKVLHDIKLNNNKTLKKKLEIIVWNWHPINFIFFNGEILSGYNISHYKNTKVICVGYTNGMVGYIPTKEDILKGGYEVDKSRRSFRIPNRLSVKNEIIIKSKIKKLLE